MVSWFLVVSRWCLGGFLVVSWMVSWRFLGGDCPCLGGSLVVSLWSLGGDSSVSRWFLGGFFVVSWMVSWWFLGCSPIAKGWGC